MHFLHAFVFKYTSLQFKFFTPQQEKTESVDPISKLYSEGIYYIISYYLRKGKLIKVCKYTHDSNTNKKQVEALVFVSATGQEAIAGIYDFLPLPSICLLCFLLASPLAGILYPVGSLKLSFLRDISFWEFCLNRFQSLINFSRGLGNMRRCSVYSPPCSHCIKKSCFSLRVRIIQPDPPTLSHSLFCLFFMVSQGVYNSESSGSSSSIKC